jgi:hypothetical protein
MTNTCLQKDLAFEVGILNDIEKVQSCEFSNQIFIDGHASTRLFYTKLQDVCCGTFFFGSAIAVDCNIYHYCVKMNLMLNLHLLLGNVKLYSKHDDYYASTNHWRRDLSSVEFSMYLMKLLF